MWLPSPIYQLLPHSYGVAGGFTIAHADTPMLFVSGALLVSAGLMAWKLRRLHQAKALSRKRRLAHGRRTTSVVRPNR